MTTSNPARLNVFGLSAVLMAFAGVGWLPGTLSAAQTVPIRVVDQSLTVEVQIEDSN